MVLVCVVATRAMQEIEKIVHHNEYTARTSHNSASTAHLRK